jgi:tetratricopeptide (TPR) repeat protein
MMETTANLDEVIRAAAAHYQKKHYLSSAENYLIARRLHLEAGDPFQAAIMANNAAVSFLQAGDAHQSLETIAGTCEVFNQVGEKLHHAMALGNLASARHMIGERTEASSLYLQSLDMLKGLERPDLEAAVYRSLARLNLETGSILTCFSYVRKALKSEEDNSTSGSILKKLFSIIDMLSKPGDRE